MSATMKLVSTTNNTEVILGNPDLTPDFIMTGKPETLLEIVNGSRIFVEASMTGEIDLQTSVGHLAALTDISVKRLLGEI